PRPPLTDAPHPLAVFSNPAVTEDAGPLATLATPKTSEFEPESTLFQPPMIPANDVKSWLYPSTTLCEPVCVPAPSSYPMIRLPSPFALAVLPAPLAIWRFAPVIVSVGCPLRPWGL